MALRICFFLLLINDAVYGWISGALLKCTVQEFLGASIKAADVSGFLSRNLSLGCQSRMCLGDQLSVRIWI